jgi:DNA-binding SARP family transcriptional activator
VDERDWRTRQARQLLKILITGRPRPISNDWLIETLWPESTLEAAATTLRSAINALRNVLEPHRPKRTPSSYIHTQAPGYAFRSHQDIWLDVEIFEAYLDRAGATAEPGEQQRLLESALAIYHDDYLTEDPYADWAKPERERLQERFFASLLSLANLYAHHGHYGPAIATCRRVLAKDEVREGAYQALMRYQAESGDSAAALLTYERCRHVLSEQLGADPSPLTQQLHSRILNGEIETAPVAALTSHTIQEAPSPPRANGTQPAPADPADPSAPLGLPRHSLLPAIEDGPDAFVGRQAEISALQARLAVALSGQGSIALITGEMGIGKSRLAHHLLAEAGEAGATVIGVACQPLEQSLPYAALADALSRYIQLLPDSALAQLPPASLSQLALILPSLQDRLQTPPLTGEMPLSPEEHQQRVMDGMVAFITGLADLRPLVLFLDDLQWADAETLAVVSRLSVRVAQHPLLLLLAYRQGDLTENSDLQALLHTLRRTPRTLSQTVDRLGLADVQLLISRLTGEAEASRDLAQGLFEITAGNPLFLAESLRALQERAAGQKRQVDLLSYWLAAPQLEPLSRRSRVQEVIAERIERLPPAALAVLQLAAVIGRDFSLDLLEGAASGDPLAGLEILLARQFLVERMDERIDFVHQVVRQVAYEGLHTLLRRRLHRQVAEALAQHQQPQSPMEIAFHYGQAGLLNRLDYARFSVLAGERLLRSYSPTQALIHFENALNTLGSLDQSPREWTQRALQGEGLAYESLLDPDGVTQSYDRLRQWALSQGDKELALMAHTRLTTLLGLVGQQAESNALMAELMGDSREDALPALVDLLARRQLLFSEESLPDPAPAWQPLVEPPHLPGDPVADLTANLGAVHAALPLLIYGWITQVQGQLAPSEGMLRAAIRLAEETGQLSLASLGYHQLAVTMRLLGDEAQAQALNRESRTMNLRVHGTAAQLASLWPRISSGYQALVAGELDLAQARFERVHTFLADRGGFRTHRNSTVIGLGLVALARQEWDGAEALLREGLADPHNRYPFTYVKGLLGLAQIAHEQGKLPQAEALLRRSLTYAGQRSLVREYHETLAEIKRLGIDSPEMGRG